MAWTQFEYDALKAAIARGTQSVTFGNRTVTYHSLKDMMALLAEMERELNPAARTYRLSSHYKGV